MTRKSGRTSVERRQFLGSLGALGALGALSASGLLSGCEDAGGDTADADAGGGSGGAGGAGGGGPALNVLFLVVDQERYPRNLPGSLNLPGHERLLRSGVSFTRHYANAMPCTPSRSVMYTGQHVSKTTMYSNIGFDQGNMPPALPTLGTMFQQRGYDTVYFGKWHLSEIESDRACEPKTADALAPYGFAQYNECGDYQGVMLSGYRDDPDIADVAAAWLAARGQADAGRPFLLAVNFVNPHDIMFYYPDGLRGGGFGTDAPPDPLYATRHAVTLPDNHRESATDAGKPAAHADYQGMYDTLQPYPETPQGEADLRDFVNYYYNCIADVDRKLVQVLDALDAAGLTDSTMIVFTGDHGELASAHGLRGKGPFVYEENNHVPLIIAKPGVAGGREVTGLTAHVDLVPTLLALTGQTEAESRAANPGLAGKDVSALVDAPDAASPRTELVMTYDFSSGIDVPGSNAQVQAMLAMRGQTPSTTRTFLRGFFDGRYKFARYFDPSDYHLPADYDELVARNDLELYDLQADPEENENLAREPAGVRTLLESLNTRLNALITAELGSDTGRAG